MAFGLVPGNRVITDRDPHSINIDLGNHFTAPQIISYPFNRRIFDRFVFLAAIAVAFTAVWMIFMLSYILMRVPVAIAIPLTGALVGLMTATVVVDQRW